MVKQPCRHRACFKVHRFAASTFFLTKGEAKGGGGDRGHGPPQIEMLPMIKMSQKRLLFLQFLLVSSRTTVINNIVDPWGQGPFNLIFANQFKWTSYNNIQMGPQQ